jgi:hypothetical protein
VSVEESCDTCSEHDDDVTLIVLSTATATTAAAAVARGRAESAFNFLRLSFLPSTFLCRF